MPNTANSSSNVSIFLRNKRFALWLILILGTIIRIWGVQNYQPNMDEIQFIIMAKGENLAEVWRRSLIEVHPPLASFIRHFLLLITENIFIQRLFSVAAMMFGVIGCYHIGKAAHNRSAGVFCAGAMAFTPICVISSFTLRNYAFFMLFLVWAYVFFLRWQTKEKSKDLFAYTLLIFCASACHFTGFFVAAALGIAEGIRLLYLRQFRRFLLFSFTHIPLITLAVFLAIHFLAPGKSVPLWHDYGVITGAIAKNSPGTVDKLLLPIVMYFSPYLHVAHTWLENDLVPINLRSYLKIIIMLGGIAVFISYVYALYILIIRAPLHHLASPIITLWVISLLLSWFGAYPLYSALRHSLYLLPFFILPIGIMCASLVERVLKTDHAKYFIMVTVAGFSLLAESAVPYDVELCLTNRDFRDSITYLNTHIHKGDAIVTGPIGAYFHLLYALDKGKTPYDAYADVPFFEGTTLLAPFAYGPYKPINSWHVFKEYLETRLRKGAVSEEGSLWFVSMGWKGQEVWNLMKCSPVQDKIAYFFSRDGVLIFSIRAKDMITLLAQNTIWETCYVDYTPLATAHTFGQVLPPQKRLK